MDNKAEKKAKFKKYANLRLKNAIKAIELLGNLSNRNSYEFSEDDSKKIHSELKKACDATKARFESSIKNAKGNDDFF